MWFINLLLAYLLVSSFVVQLLQQSAPLIETAITSGVMYVVNEVVGWTRTWPNGRKLFVFGLLGVVIANVSGLIGGSVTADWTTWGPSTAQGLVQAAIAAAIYKLGSTKSPTPPVTD